jgi:hypothetical protein
MGLALACARPPPHHSDALARSRALLDAASALESDLHFGESEIGYFGELEARRKSATEVTCQVADVHIREIERLAEAQRLKRREKARRRKELALLHREHPQATVE